MELLADLCAYNRRAMGACPPLVVTPDTADHQDDKDHDCDQYDLESIPQRVVHDVPDALAGTCAGHWVMVGARVTARRAFWVRIVEAHDRKLLPSGNVGRLGRSCEY